MDYSSMKATKTKRSYDGDVSVSRSSKRKMKKQAKKLNWLIVLPMILIGLAIGFFGLKFAFRNDGFSMVEAKTVDEIMYIGGDSDYEKYTELGVKCVSFGKDYSGEVSVTYYYRNDLSSEAKQVEKVDENVAGMYYAVYKTDAPRYKKVTLIRNIVVLGVEDNG